jgi:hypothetical protein
MMRTFILMMVAGLLFASPAHVAPLASDNGGSTPAVSADTPIVIAQNAPAQPKKKKVWLRRVCEKSQMRCACADTGTSACCTAQQTCNCQPTANCR